MSKKLSGLYGALLLGLCISPDVARALPLASDQEQVTVTPPYIIRQQTLARNLSGQPQETRISVESRISYTDLDFSKQSDVDIMRDRLKNAARDICAKVNRNPRNLSYIPVEERNCIKTTTLESFAQLDGIRASAGRRSASQSAKN